MELTNVYYTGPVTALSARGNQVLAGVGSTLHVYDITERRCIHRVPVFPCRNIHGIREAPVTFPGAGTLCIFGEKCARILMLTCDSKIDATFLTELCEFEDWVWDAAWLVKDSTSTLALGLGHNVVLHWDWQTNVILHRVYCAEKCILYCAKFIGSSWESLVLAAGTVFNQVVLWAPGPKTNTDGQGCVLQRLTGHKGVIFSVDYHSPRQQLCSVSDDRSIRVWQLIFPGKQESSVNRILSIEDWLEVEVTVLHVLYGHSARVWDARILTSRIVSVGEDSTCCVWDNTGNIVCRFRGHKGRSIWSLAVNEDERYVVTGGGDTSVRVWLLSQTGPEKSITTYSLSIPQISDSEDFPRTVQLLSVDTVLVMTNSGALYSHRISSNEWKTVMADSRFKSYTVMAVSMLGSYIAVGNIFGHVKLLHCSQARSVQASAYHPVPGNDAQCPAFEDQIYEGKVLSIIWLSDDVFLTTGPEGVMILWQVKTGLVASHIMTLTKLEVFLLPPCKQRWVSAAALTPDLSSLICGDRGGTVHLYHLGRGSASGEMIKTDSSQHALRPVFSFPKLHGKTGVTSVCCHGDSVYTAGRDGLYRQYTYSSGKLEVLNSNRVFKGLEWIDRITFTADNELLIHGFHMSHYVLWSVAQNQKLMEVECGGGHRSWDCSRVQDKVCFVYVKAREVVCCKTELASNQLILKESLHGREVCDVKHILSGTTQTGGPAHLLVTCSEDTTINISTLQSNGAGIMELSSLQTVHGHISSVRTLAVSNTRLSRTERHTCLMFSAGGRAQIKVWRLTVYPHTAGNAKVQINPASVIHPSMGVSTDDKHADYSLSDVSEPLTFQQPASKDRIRSASDSKSSKETTCMYRCTHEALAELMLQGGHHKRRHKPWRTHSVQANPETRILDITTFCVCDFIENYIGGNVHFFATACSDSFVRFFAFNEDSREITPLALSSFHNHCVLKVQHFVYRTKAGNRVVIMSAATDGQVAFWDFTYLCHEYLERLRRTNRADETESSRTEQIFKDQADKSKQESDCMESGGISVNTHGVQSDNVADSGGYPDTGTSDISRDLSDQTDHEHGGSSEDESPQPFYSVRAHQSGVNSLSIAHTEDNRYLLVSGGDDNALKVSVLTVKVDIVEGAYNGVPNLTVVEHGMGGKLDAHTAQITGSWILSPFKILTASIDQRVCIWQLHHSGEDIQLEMVSCQFVSVADIANIDVWTYQGRTYICLCGEGLAILNTSS